MNARVLILTAAAGLLITAPTAGQMGMRGGIMGGGMSGPGMMGQGAHGTSILRHRYVMAYGIDPTYVGARNPLAASSENLKAGAALFQKNCAACHGESGRGDGPAARGMTPPPSNLAATVESPIASDAYLDWTVSEGGVPVRSPMPPFKTVLSNDQIWKVVLYLRSL